MAAQAFIIDDTGILGRKYDLEADASKGTFLPKQIRIINNTILFTDDNWETAKTALGEITLDDGVTSYGLVAETIVGNLLLGENLIIKGGSSQDGTVTIDGGGILIKDSSGNPVFKATSGGELYVKNYATQAGTESLIETTKEGIMLRVGEVAGSVDSLATRLAAAETSITQNANTITLKANQSALDALGNTVGEHTATLATQANEIAAKVSKTGGSNSSFGWSLTADGFFLKSSEKTVVSCDSNGLTVEGTIKADRGNIAGLLIERGSRVVNEENHILKFIRTPSDEFHIMVEEKASGEVVSSEVAITSLLCDSITARNSENEIDMCWSSGGMEVTATVFCTNVQSGTISGHWFLSGYINIQVTSTSSSFSGLLQNTDFVIVHTLNGEQMTNTVRVLKGNSSAVSTFFYAIPNQQFNLTAAKFIESGESTLSFTTIEATDMAISARGDFIPRVTNTYKIGSEDFRWNGFYNELNVEQSIVLGGKKLTVPAVTRDEIEVRESDGNTHDSFSNETAVKAKRNIITFGNFDFICIEYPGIVSTDRWYRIKLPGNTAKTFYSIQVSPRGDGNTSLAYDSHGGNLVAYGSGLYVYIGCDTYKCESGFYATIICPHIL